MGHKKHSADRVVAAAGGHQYPLRLADKLVGARWAVLLRHPSLMSAIIEDPLLPLPTGQKWKAILFVTFAQMLCGIAKDLTKLGGKTVTKLVTPDEKQSQLFRLVSLVRRLGQWPCFTLTEIFTFTKKLAARFSNC